MFDFVFDFGAFWVPFWLHFGTPNRSCWGSIFALFLDVAPRGAQERQKRRQEAPKGSPGANLGAKSCHFGAQEAILGGKNHQKPLVFLAFREKNHVFFSNENEKSHKKRCSRQWSSIVELQRRFPFSAAQVSESASLYQWFS